MPSLRRLPLLALLATGLLGTACFHHFGTSSLPADPVGPSAAEGSDTLICRFLAPDHGPTTGDEPIVVYRRDLSHLGWPLGSEVRQELASLRTEEGRYQ